MLCCELPQATLPTFLLVAKKALTKHCANLQFELVLILCFIWKYSWCCLEVKNGGTN